MKLFQVNSNEREREKERETDRQRETDREREREKEGQRESWKKFGQRNPVNENQN